MWSCYSKKEQEEFSWDHTFSYSHHIFFLSWQKIQAKKIEWYQTPYEITRDVQWKLTENLNIMTMALSSSPLRILNSCSSFKSTILVNKKNFIQLLKLDLQSTPSLLLWAYSLLLLFHHSTIWWIMVCLSNWISEPCRQTFSTITLTYVALSLAPRVLCHNNKWHSSKLRFFYIVVVPVFFYFSTFLSTLTLCVWCLH